MTDDSTQKNLNILSRKLRQYPKPMLLTGAGFSYEAKNGLGQPLPLGKDLRKMLVTDLLGLDEESEDAKALMGHSLDRVYQHVSSSNPLQAKSFLIKLFSQCHPEEFHRIIARFPWQKIYTFNVDDLMENAIQPAYFNVINSKTPLKRSNVGVIDYVKLHGCVRNHSDGFVFSETEYTMKSVDDDPRFADFVKDALVEDFVVIGASGVEPDIEHYFAKYGQPGRSMQGNFFYVDPSPDILVRERIKRAGAHLIEMTAKEFAAWLYTETKDIGRGRKAVTSAQFRQSFRDVGEYIRLHQNSDNTDSRLYEGENPTWLDIITGYDFRKKITSRILDYINSEIKANDCNLIIPLLSKAIGGKSVGIKRLGYELSRQGIEVYEYIGDRFRVRTFIDFTSRTPGNQIALLVDNGSNFYSYIGNLLENFPKEKQLIVLAASRPYFHYKKYYDLRHLSGYKEFRLDEDSVEANLLLARSAVDTLSNKGLLGHLKGLNDEERVRHFRKYDLPQALWTVFHGVTFKKRFESSYNRLLHEIERHPNEPWRIKAKQVLFALALFNNRELSYIPDIVLSLWLQSDKSRIVNLLGDIVKTEERNGISLRTDMLTEIILKNADEKLKQSVLRDILRVIAPYIGRNLPYYNQIQGRLMNELFLRLELGIPAIKVRELMNKLLDYYREDHNYLIQLGRVEQSMGQYVKSLNHLIQAQILAPGSYNVKNSIARNYLKQAYGDKNLSRQEAAEAYATGRKLMFELIDHCEQYQVRAYSIHSLIVESVAYWENFRIIPARREFDELDDILNEAVGDYSEDPRFNHAVKVLHKFAESVKLKSRIRRSNYESLAYMRGILSKQESKQLISDDLPEEID